MKRPLPGADRRETGQLVEDGKGHGGCTPGRHEHTLGRRAGRLVVNSLLVAASLVSAYALCEVGFRAWFDIKPMPWFYEINELDFRGRHPSRERGAPGARRVMILGDSYAFGFGVAQEDILAARLETSGQVQAAPQVEALNFSRMGWNTCAARDFFLSKGVSFDFDDLLLTVTFNDIEPEPLTVRNQQALCLFTQMTMLHALVYRLYGFKQRLLQGKDYGQALAEWYAQGDGPLARRMRECILDLKRYCDQHGKRFAVLLFETPDADGVGLRAVVHRELGSWCTRLGIPYASLPPASAERRRELTLHVFDEHPNAQAHVLAAQEAARMLGGAPR